MCKSHGISTYKLTQRNNNQSCQKSFFLFPFFLGSPFNLFTPRRGFEQDAIQICNYDFKQPFSLVVTINQGHVFYMPVMSQQTP